MSRGKAPIMQYRVHFEIINAKSLSAEFKKIIDHFEGNLISFKITLYKI